jgi:putative transposase
MNDWWIVRLAIQPDHVHMLLELPPTITVAKAVQIMKGGSSRAVRQTNPELEEWLWGDSFWADGYFAESVGKVDETIIKAYIENQAGPSRPKVR